jgi:hypothetical protein
MARSLINHLCRNGLFALPVIIVAGCAGNGEGLDANGRPDNGGGGAVSQFQQIQDTIFTPVCTNCHIGAGAPQGLRLDAGNSFALLVNAPSSQVPGTLRVNPGNPNASYLVQKIEGTAAVGARMPLGGPFLNQAQVDLVRAWIAAGAPMTEAPPGQLLVTSSVPAPAEQAGAGLSKMTVIFNADVDNSLVSTNSFELRDAAGNLVPITARVPLNRQNVVELATLAPLAAGRFELSVRGSGPAPLASVSGRVLDGDADGNAGGDTIIPFDVNAGESR